MVFLSLSLALYAISYFIPQHLGYLFLFLSFVSRVLEGVTVIVALNALVSLLSINFAHQRGKALSARACGANLAFSLGAVIGGVLYPHLGYFGVFMIFAFVSLLTSLLLLVFNEARGNFRARDVGSQVTACQLFSLRRPMVSLVCNALCDVLPQSLTPTLANKLRTDFDLSTPQIGAYFFLLCGGGALSMASMILVPE